MAFRAFLSADLGATPELRGFAEDLRATQAPLKVVNIETLHLTLKFLGDTPEAAVEAIAAAMAAAVNGEATIDLALRGAGALPSLSRINVVYVAVEDDGRLAGIARKLEEEMEHRDFQRSDRPFLAHATVARVKGGANKDALRRVIERHVATEFGTRRVDALRLKKSVLSGTGPTYSDVAVAPLQA